MTGSVALDVAIGLAFIFLLYSLLATTIMELISTFFAFRARTLRTALTRMLENRVDEPDGSGLIRFLKGLLERFEYLRKNIFGGHQYDLVKRFYKEPSIKYLAPNKFFSKPSYISPENFSKALIDILKKEGATGESDLDRIKKALDISGAATRQLFTGDTNEHLVSLLDDAQNDLVKFKLNLEQWFNDTMDRATGWYKRKMQFVLMLIGFGIAVFFNASTTEMARKLSKDKETRDQMVQLATDFVKKHEDSVKADSVFRLAEAELQADLNEANTLFGLGWPYGDEIFKVRQASNKPRKNELTIKSDSSNQQYFLEYPFGFNATDLHDYLRVWEVKSTNRVQVEFDALKFKVCTVSRGFWGYLLTALAISLGAPFWFDLLNKLVKLRGSVAKATSGQSTTGSPGTTQKTETGGAVPARLRKG